MDIHTLRLIAVKITKLFVLPVMRELHGEEVNQLNLIPATSVSILMTHKNEYKHFVKNKKKSEELAKKKGDGSKPQ